MAKYRIGLIQTVYEETTVTVEADNPEAAERLALEQAYAGAVEWRFMQASEPIAVATVDVA